MGVGKGLGMGLSRGRKWTPFDLGASLLAWWSADRTELITLSGSNVTSWKDRVAAYDLAQATAGAQPIWSATSFNGAPGVTFDGVDDFLNMESQPFPAIGENWFVFDQTLAAANTNSGTLFSYGGNLTSNSRRHHRVVTSGVNRLRCQFGDGASNVMANELATDFSGRHVIRSRATAALVSAQIDANAEVTAAGTQSLATTRVRMGATTANTAATFIGGVFRHAIVTGALSTDQAANLAIYLQNQRRA